MTACWIAWNIIGIKVSIYLLNECLYWYIVIFVFLYVQLFQPCFPDIVADSLESLRHVFNLCLSCDNVFGIFELMIEKNSIDAFDKDPIIVRSWVIRGKEKPNPKV